MRVPASTRLLALLATLVVTACLAEPPGPAVNQIDYEKPPVTLEWVGTYQGTAKGAFEGELRENVPFNILITFDQPALVTCANCITVRAADFFSQMHLLPQSPIAATWSYVHEGRRATLTMEKFSSSAAPGSVFFGTIRIAVQHPDGTLEEPTTAFDFVAERQ